MLTRMVFAYIVDWGWLRIGRPTSPLPSLSVFDGGEEHVLQLPTVLSSTVRCQLEGPCGSVLSGKRAAQVI